MTGLLCFALKLEFGSALIFGYSGGIMEIISLEREEKEDSTECSDLLV